VHLPEHPRTDIEPMATHLESNSLGSSLPSTVNHHTCGGREIRKRAGSSITRRLDRHDRLTPIRGHSDFDVTRPLPLQGAHTDRVHFGGRNWATLNRLDVVGTVTMEPRVAGAVHRKLDSGSPAEAVWVPIQSLDLYLALDAGDPAQLFRHQRRLEAPLRRERHVLPITTPATAWTGVRARRFDPIERRFEHLDSIRAQKG